MKARILLAMVIVVCTGINIYWSVRNDRMRKEFEQQLQPSLMFYWETVPQGRSKHARPDSFSYPGLPDLPKCPSPQDSDKVEI